MSGDFTPTTFITESADSAQLGPFGRLKTTQTETLWDHKNVHSRYADLWEERIAGGGTITHLPNESAVALSVGTASGDYAVRQTRRYFAYASGNGHNPFGTFVFPAPETNRVVEAGYYDGPVDPTGADWGNGLILRQDGATISYVIRSDVNENPAGARAVVENVIPQASWNLDTLDGSGDSNNPSGIELNLGTSQISDPDFQWLGVGRVRFIFNIDGQAVVVHEENHANSQTAVYMRTPTLPIRYLIWNKEATTVGATLKEICSSVKSEGKYTLPGIEYSVDTGGINAKRAIADAEVPVLVIRLANTLNGMKNRKIVRFLESNYSAATRGSSFRIAHVHDYASINANWLKVDGSPSLSPGILTDSDSGIEYAFENSAKNGNVAISGGERHFVKPKYVGAGQGGRALGDHSDTTFINNHSFISQNFDSTQSEVFAIFAEGDGGASAVWAAFDFVEFE